MIYLIFAHKVLMLHGLYMLHKPDYVWQQKNESENILQKKQ